MTLAAPKSRQGKFILVLAAIAATIAVLGALNLVNNASATIPGGTTVTVTETVTHYGTRTDDTTGVVPLGSIIIHTKSLVLGATAGSPNRTTARGWTGRRTRTFSPPPSRPRAADRRSPPSDCNTMVDTYQKHGCANDGPLSNGEVMGTYILLPAASDATPYTVTSGGLTSLCSGRRGRRHPELHGPDRHQHHRSLGPVGEARSLPRNPLEHGALHHVHAAGRRDV